MKKTLFFLCMVVSMSIPCLAESFSVENDDGVSITYQITSDNTVSVVKPESSYAGDIVIPESVLNGEILYDVSAIGNNAFYACTSLTSVTIPNSVKAIGFDAFRDCVSLTTVQVPNSVKTFAPNVFSGCTNLLSVTLGDSLQTIGRGSFYNCTSLESIIIPNSVVTIEDRVFEGCSKLSSITLGNAVKSIGEYSLFRIGTLQKVIVNRLETIFNITCNGTLSNPFSVAASLYLCEEEIKNLVIPEGVTDIPNGILKNAKYITSLTIPNSVVSIGLEAFSGCANLTSISIPSSVTSIGDNAFKGCTNLATVTFSESSTHIDMGKDVFANTAWLNSKSGEVIYIGSVLYKYQGVMPENTTIEVKEGTTSIAGGAFKGCTNLTDITIPTSVTRIGRDAFAGTTWYNNQEDGTIYINNVFYKYKGEMPANTTVEVTDGTISIAGGAFENFSQLTKVVLPNSVAAIGKSAFSGCASLVNFIVGDAVATIGDDAFKGCSNLSNIYVSSNERMFAILYGDALSCGEGSSNPFMLAKHIYVDGVEVTELTLPDGMTEINSGFFYNFGKNITSVTIPNSVTTIGDGAFQGWTTLASVTIGNSVTSIGANAFSGCTALTAIELPIPISTIGKYAFSNCSNLSTITLGDSVRTIADYAFRGCSSLQTVNVHKLETMFNIKCGSNDSNPFSIASKLHLNGEEVTNLVIPEGVTEINKGFFYNFGKNITSVTIPNSVTTIGDRAFQGWTTLASVTIGNSVTSIGAFAFGGCTALTSIELPIPISTIGDQAFSGCSNLSTITLGDSVKTIAYYAFNGCGSLQTVNVHKLETMFNIKCGDWTSNPFSIASKLHLNGEEVTNLVIPEGVTEINKGFFYNFGENVTSVTIPNSVKSIGDDAFSHWPKLTTASIGNSVKDIGSRAFYNCAALKSVVLGDSVKTIEDWAFDGTGLTSVTLPSSLESIGSYAFRNCANLEKVNVTSILTLCNIAYNTAESNPLSIANHLFLNDEEVTELVIPEGVTQISQIAFIGARAITSVTIPNTVKVIKNRAFGNCTNLSYITLGDSVRTIADDVFLGCSNLQTVNVNKLETMFNIKCGNWNSNPFSIASKLHLNGEEVTNLVIPEGVTEINKGFFYNFGRNVTSVTIPSSVKVGDYAFSHWPKLASISVERLGDGAFEGCSALTSITLGSSVDTIAAGAFRNCTGLESVVIPNTVKVIENRAFEGCTKLSSITLGNAIDSIGEAAFKGCDSLKRVDVTDLDTWYAINFADQSANPLTIAKHLYYNGEEVVGLTIPEGITEINYGFFSGYENITSIVLPSSVVKIGDRAFMNLVNLKSVTLSESLETIGEGAFQNCTSLISVKVPNSVKSLAPYVFSRCTNLESVILSDSLRTIGAGSFHRCGNLRSIVIPNSVVSIGDRVFEFCTNLSYITLGDSVKTIAEYAFNGCDSLQTVNVHKLKTMFDIKCDGNWSNPFSKASKLHLNGEKVTNLVIPEGVTQINQGFLYNFGRNVTSVTIPSSVKVGNYAFKNWSKLASISVERLGNNAFEGCSALTSITLGCSVDTINAGAFRNCSGLESVVIPNTVKVIENRAFEGCTKLSSITLGNAIDSIGEAAFEGCDSLKRVDVTNLDTWYAINFANQSANPLTIAKHLYYNGEEVVGLTIPEGITEINYGFFSGYENITSIVLPSSVVKIGDRAFKDLVNLKSVTLSESLETIGEGAFQNCTSLISVKVPNSVKSLAPYVFSGCTNLESIILSDSLRTIGAGSFHRCGNLKSIVIPNSVVSIGDRVFEFCTNLSYITLGDSVKTIAEYAFNGCDSLQTVNVNKLETMFDIQFDSREGNPFSKASRLHLNGEEVTNLVIPEGVTEINSGFFYNFGGNVTSVTIPNTVKFIDGFAFCYWPNLTAVSIGNSVETIGYNAFEGCSSLTSVTIGGSVKNIQERVFNECPSLASVHVTDIATLCNTGFNGSDSNPLSIAKHLFLNDVEVTDLVIPEGVTQISQYAFVGAEAITSVTIPNSVKSIGSNAFNGCKSLSYLALGDSVKNFYSGAFNGCDSLTINVTNLEALFNDFKFDGYQSNPFEIAKHLCVNDEEIVDLVVPNTVKKIYGVVFNGRKIKSLVIPNSVEMIGNNAFRDCVQLESVSLGNSVDTIGAGAFANCKALTSIEIPNSVTHLSDYAFSACDNLSSVTLGSSIQTIGDGAFEYCKALTSIEIPHSVTHLSDYAFYECNSLSSVTLGNSIQTIGDGAFQYCRALTSIEIPNSVTTISRNAFYDCYGLESVTLGSSIQSIGEGAFGYIGLSLGHHTQVYIPSVDWLFKVEINDYNNEHLFNNMYIGKQPLKALEVPDNVVNAPILPKLYNSCITSLNTGNGLKVLPEGCSWNFTQVTLGNNITEVKGEFPNALIVVSNASKVPTITENTFPKCMFDNGAEGVVILQSPSEQNRYAAAKYWEGMQLTNQTNIVDVFVNTPGDLSLEIIEKHRMAIPKVVGLTVRGEINDDDFIQMNKNMKSLLYLDLSEAIVERVPDYAFDGKQQLLSLKLPNTTKVVGNYAFRGCHGIEDLALPTDLTEIGDEAFAGTNIVTLDFNYALTKIGNRAFANTPLKEVSFQNKVESIGNEAFQGCNLEQELLFSETLTSIGERAFEGQDGITGHLTIPESVTTVGRNAFSGTNIFTVFISSKMTTIESEVFANCPLLDVVYIPDNITRINASAFQGCTSLKNLRLSQGVEEIEREAFRSIPIRSINVPENVKTLSEYTFADCANLRFVTLPSTITDLGEGVFYNCRQLMNLTVKAITPPTVKANTFRGVNTDRCILSIPTVSYRNYVLAEYWGRFIQMRNDIAVQTKGNGSISFASGETEGEEDAPAQVRRATRAATEKESMVTTVENGSSLYVPKDGTVRFYITPAEGEKIVSATFDGEDITSQIVGGVFVTTADKQSAKLEVNFSELTKTAQVITWEQNFEPMMVGDKITLNATASSGLVVTYLFGDSESSGYASLNGSTLTIEKSGTIALIAQQQGDNKYASIATDVKYIHAYEYGDADANREINSADLATTIDYVIGHAPQEFLFKAADVNKDKRVNVADVSGVVDIVLTAPATTDKATRTDDMTIGEVLYAELAINSIDFDLSNEKGEFLTFQCDIRLSDDCLPRLDNAGNPVVTIRKSEVQQNTQVAVARLLENGNIRILVYSTENTPIVNNHTLALQLESVSKNSDIEILSGGYSYREDGHIVYHAFDYGFVNGLESKGDVISQMKIKATGNEVSIYSPVDYLLSVSSIDGVVYKLDVKAGYNRFAMNQGVYIIGKNKVIIR